MPVERLSFRDEILEFTSGAVAGAYQNKDALLLAGGDFDEWRDSVAAQVGVDGQRVGMPRTFERCSNGDFAKVASSIRLGGRANVVSFAVDDHGQAMLARVGRTGIQGGEAMRAVGFIKRRLKLHGWNNGCDDVDHVAAKTAECLWNPFTIGRESFQETSRKFIGARVDTNADRVTGSLHRRE